MDKYTNKWSQLAIVVLMFRYMMLIAGKGEVYLFDRSNTVFAAPQFIFPRRKYQDQHVEDTLIDGVSRIVSKLCELDRQTDRQTDRQIRQTSHDQTDKS